MPKVREMMAAAKPRAFWRGVSLAYVERARRWSLSAERRSWSLRESWEEECWEYGVLREEVRRTQAGRLFWFSGEGDGRGDMGRDRARAADE